MSPRVLDWRSVQAKLRLMRSLLDQLESIGPVAPDRLSVEPLVGLALGRRVVSDAVPLAVEHDGSYVRQVAAFADAESSAES